MVLDRAQQPFGHVPLLAGHDQQLFLAAKRRLGLPESRREPAAYAAADPWATVSVTALDVLIEGSGWRCVRVHEIDDRLVVALERVV